MRRRSSAVEVVDERLSFPSSNSLCVRGGRSLCVGLEGIFLCSPWLAATHKKLLSRRSCTRGLYYSTTRNKTD